MASNSSAGHRCHVQGTGHPDKRFTLVWNPQRNREFAEKCDRLVEETKDPRHKQVLREMAQAWRNLADEENEKRTP
jgi:hypothetical protein